MSQAASPASPLATDTANRNNAFAGNLFAQLNKTIGDKNLFLSPYSISSALAMTAQGARGKTQEQMHRALHIPADGGGFLDASMFQTGMAEITAALNPKDAAFELSVANNLWVDRSFPLADGFVAAAKTNYAAGVVPLDFANNAEAARQQINTAIAAQTHDKIQNLLGPRTVDPSTALVLTNAIYFKGTWQYPFPKTSTSDQPFHAPTGDQTVPMMRSPGDARYLYGETEDAQIVALPYRGGTVPPASGPDARPAGMPPAPSTLSMLIILPKKPDGLPALEKQLTPDTLTKWTANLARQEVHVFLPRFTMTTQFELSAQLKALGMTDAFTRDADFTGISNSAANKLSISAVIHKAYIDVNEEGTEAAAATAVVMVGAARRPGQPPEFRADHPFLFLIRHEPTGSILFLGHLNSVK